MANISKSNLSENALVAILLAASLAAQGRTRPVQQRNLGDAGRAIGMAGDGNELAVLVFDANTDTSLGIVAIAAGSPLCFGDCVITSDLTRGYVATLFGEIWVIDLTTTPPSLAAGNNPFEITNFGLDLALTPDDRFLVVAAGNTPQEIAVVNLATRTVVDQLLVGNCVAVEVAPDGSVLAASESLNRVQRLTLDAAGQLTDTGVSLAENNPLNLAVAPGGSIGLLSGYTPGRVRSFTLPGLMPIDSLTPPGADFIAGIVPDPSANRLYVRKNFSLQAYDFDPATGDIGASSLWSIGLTNLVACYGVEEVAVHPDGTRIYTPVQNGVRVLDAATGTPGVLISNPGILFPTGVCVRAVGPETPVAIDVKPGACPNAFNPESHGVLPVAVLGSAELDVSEIDLATLTLARADGTGGSVMPNEGPPGPHTELEDVSSPIKFDACSCHKGESDGFVDLVAKFHTDELVAALELGGLPGGTEVELVLAGELSDGTRFSGHDCVLLVPPGAPPGELTIITEPGAFVQVSPLDEQLDAGGFGSFERTYTQGTLVTLTATEIDGLPFFAWQVDGVVQKVGATTLEYRVKFAQAELKAIYAARRPKLR